MLIFIFSISHPGKQKMVRLCRDAWALTRTFSVNRKKYNFFITSEFKKMIKSFLLHFDIVVHCLCFLKYCVPGQAQKILSGGTRGAKNQGRDKTV